MPKQPSPYDRPVYTCARCGKTFRSHTTEVEANAEAFRNYGVSDAHTSVTMEIVCGECYRRAKEVKGVVL